MAVVQRCSPCGRGSTVFAMRPWFSGVRHVAVVQRCSPCGRGSAVFAMWLWFNGVRHVAVVQRCSPKGSGPRRTQVSSGELCLHVMESTCNCTFGLNPSYNPLHSVRAVLISRTACVPLGVKPTNCQKKSTTVH